MAKFDSDRTMGHLHPPNNSYPNEGGKEREFAKNNSDQGMLYGTRHVSRGNESLITASDASAITERSGADTCMIKFDGMVVEIGSVSPENNSQEGDAAKTSNQRKKAVDNAGVFYGTRHISRGDESLITPSDASAYTEKSGMNQCKRFHSYAEGGPALAEKSNGDDSFCTGMSSIGANDVEPVLLVRKTPSNQLPLCPKRKVSDLDEIPRPVFERTVTAPTLTQTELLCCTTPPTGPPALMRSNTSPTLACSPLPPVRRKSPPPKRASQPTRKQTPSPLNEKQLVFEEKLPKLKREKHKSFSRRSRQSPGKPSSIKKPTASELDRKEVKRKRECVLFHARREAIYYVMQSEVDSLYDPSNAPQSPRMLSDDKRRISSLTFLSMRAPCAPGEREHSEPTILYKEKTERMSHRVSFVENGTWNPPSAKKAKSSDIKSKETVERTKGCGSRGLNHIMKHRVSHNVPEAGTGFLRAWMGSTATCGPTTCSGSKGIHVMSQPSMVVIPELEESSTPAPLPNLQRQPDLAVPGAWRMPRVLRSFAISVHRQRDNGEGTGDDVSRSSHNTARSLLTAAWSLIVPTRRLESVVPIAVKPANSEPTIKRKCMFCGLCCFLLIIICLAFTLVFVHADNTKEAPIQNVISTEPKPTFSTLSPTSSLESFTQNPLPNKPNLGGMMKPRGSD